MPHPQATTTTHRLRGAAADLVAVVVFTIIGRLSHHEGLGAAELWHTTWPFLVGTLVAWMALSTTKTSGMRLSRGVGVVVTTVLIGMILRVLAGGSTQPSFIVVALIFLTLLMLGWRLVLALVTRGQNS